MEKLVPGTITPQSIERTHQALIEKAERDPEFAQTFGGKEGAIAYALDLLHHQKSYVNDTYHVLTRQMGEASIHLSIKRHDRKPIFFQEDLQEIKNQILGEEREAFELYPAESRRMDTANQYHLFASTDPIYRFPFQFEGIDDLPGRRHTGRYRVIIQPCQDSFACLIAQRRDRKELRDWRELQAIKNEIVGEECEAIALYPAESRKFDRERGQFVLFASTDSDYRFPFGFNTRFVTDEPLYQSKNRRLRR